jgi:hypothetical protein
VLTWRRRLRDRLTGAVEEQDLKLIRNGLTPVSAPSLRPQVELAIETAVAASADALPVRWADAVRDNVSRSGDDLVHALDRKVSEVDLELSPPPWWWLATVAQYLLGLAAVVGALWLLLLGLAGLINNDAIDSAPVLGVPLPLVLLVLGLLGGALLAALSNWALVVGARRRRLSAEERLTSAVQAVADDRVMTPIRVVLDQHRLTRLALTGRHAELAPRENVDSVRPMAPTVGAAPGSTPVAMNGTGPANATPEAVARQLAV